MSYSIPKTSIVIAIGGCLLVASMFFYFLYMPNRKILDQNSDQITELEQKIHIETAVTTSLKKKLASLDIENASLNYFNRLDLEEPDRIPCLLKNLTQEANALGIKFLSVDPQVPEKKDLYRKYVFKVNVRASFQQMLYFLDCIENKLKLNIDRFSMSRADLFDAARVHTDLPSDISDLVTASIYINSLELEDSQLKDFQSLAQVKAFYLDPNMMDMSAIPSPQFEDAEQEALIAQAVHNDPFHPERLLPSYARRSPDKLLSDKQYLLVKKDDKELVVNAIIDFQEERIAILGQDLVKNGDVLENTQVGERNVDMKVLNIGENTVTLGDGQEKYVLKLPNNPVQLK
ncbi:MAG: type 4a pilus biogenesis protein PilO [bacterium]